MSARYGIKRSKGIAVMHHYKRRQTAAYGDSVYQVPLACAESVNI
jgi:hypothetical protein